jgi:uncharacterized protein YecE (DUF72 family)
MGFGYPQWADVFYPRELKAGDYLSYYSRHFDTVELDTTFYAVPPADRVRRWSDVTPDHFRFSAKAPRLVTHDLPLKQGIVPMMQFMDVMRSLGEKLAVVLLQFPPSFSSREADALDQFLSEMPGDLHFAAEFRHPSWQGIGTVDLLRKHRVAWASTDYQGALAEVQPTADFLYIRWIGEHHRFPDMNHVQADVTDRLQWWRREIESKTNDMEIDKVWGFFNNDFSGYAVATCNSFKEMLGMPIGQPVSEAAQLKLFA